MEELQDAIEDAQYVNAISTQEDGPRPVLAWDIPTEDQLEAWKEKVERKNKNAYSLEWTLSSAIGLFLFSAFLKETQNDHLRINLCEEVIRWKKLRGRQRVDKAKRIIATYLKPQTSSSLTPKTEIDEYDLERTVPQLDDIETYMSQNFDISTQNSCVGLHGPVLDTIFTKMQAVEQARASYKREKEKQKAEEPQLEESGNGECPFTEHDHEEEEEQQLDVRQQTREDSTRSHSHSHSGDVSKDLSISRHSAQIRLVTKKPDVGPRYLSDDVFDIAEAIVMESLRKQYWGAFLESDQYIKLMHFLWYQDRRVSPEDFFVMRVLGRGGFGLVTACKKGTSGKLYAMKVMNKRRIKMKKSEQLTLNERAALAAVESPFVVNLKYSFHSKDDVFLILDLMTGGDLGYHLHQKGSFPKKECVYYAARIMLGLQALHDKRYVYRDLKPENCLLAEDGRVKITDLGLATKITPTLHGAAGTRGYWAPEMLRRDKKGKRMPYGHTVDWFSFGCCLAEFISGQNPFRSEAALNFGLERGKQTKEKAIDCATLEMEPKLESDRFDEDGVDLCRKLLDKNEKNRIGASGCEEIMAHPWFKDVIWEHILSDRRKPPFVPPKDVNAASQSEIGVFAEDKTYQEIVIELKDEEFYKRWDWTNPRAFAAEVIEFLIYERETGEPLMPAPPHGSCCCVIS
eukprot:CAMPEP_0119004162 /NCGR_PEP_ID=MMETSP1176-20130426/987_1 /TAXON_ID=265551 /ORGANISM="Synedropsis recta cf, Strain CCMP1620" /LENGTH=684 /DNA_ID=CAMNT_0006955841 /DNA_START=247 /DNA_END=2301 /DNA_ORIENTATION=+